ncbi:hypothetical protein IAR55_002847 [Kwoniella newhampshirensis]|uniref:Uncharacterized protein n=1 Tax=Kwoniella newhampshirensis TaxID=1651941 RepID=A0AAW0YRZ1_9TREE
MLRINGADEYIDQTQVAAMRPLLGQFWNSSISWTTGVNCSTSINFVGTDIWAYGISSPDQGSFLATLDDHTLGTYAMTETDPQKTDYHHLIFAAHGLEEGQSHTLTLTNQIEGKGLAFDYAVVESKGCVRLLLYMLITTRRSQTLDPGTPTKPLDPAVSASLAAAAAAAASASAAQAMLPYHFTPAQLASLTQEYKYHWNGIAQFVLIFSCFILVLCLFFISRTIVHTILERRKNRKQSLDSLFIMYPNSSKRTEKNPAGGSETYLVHTGEKKLKRTTRLMDALRGKKISPPLASDNGSITTGEGLRSGQGSRRGSGDSGLDPHQEQTDDGSHGKWRGAVEG